jgi:hypothetical protein
MRKTKWLTWGFVCCSSKSPRDTYISVAETSTSLFIGSLWPRLPLALLWCMVHYVQVLINHSSTTILSHITLHVFHRLILETFFLWSSCFHSYPILTSSTWSILLWLRSSHKCLTMLMFNFFLFIWVSCLTWHRFFNMKLFIGWLCMLIT